MADKFLSLACEICGFVGLEDGCDGYFYCGRCGSQAHGIRDTAVENDDMLLSKDNVSCSFQRRSSVAKLNPFSQSQPRSQLWETLYRDYEDDANSGDAVGPTEPADFATKSKTLTYEDYCTELRMRYVMGVQIMIQLQIKALVEKFNVCPIIVNMIQPIWLRFVASTKVFTVEWLNEVINESESQVQGEVEPVKARGRHKAEPHNLLGRRLIVIWYQALSKTIPLSYSLAISFLLCHLAREPVLPTDIAKWALEGELPYFSAFVEIQRQIGTPTNACPLRSTVMFRPVETISVQKLESFAASIAHTIGLELPPVNFYAIASRYLKQLSLPVETILPHACRIYEWSMPPELWLSTNESGLPTRAYVLSILMVSIRILYNIHGFGKWEMSLPCAVKKKDGKKSKVVDGCADKEMGDANYTAELSGPCSNSRRDADGSAVAEPDYADDSAAESDNMQATPDLDATHILLVLESKYHELIDTSDMSKDLEAYLKYCKDVVFAGLNDLSFEDHEESQIIKDLMAFYKKKKEDNKPKETCSPSTSRPLKRPAHCSTSKMKKGKTPQIDNAEITLDPKESPKENAIRLMISNMEENNFTYLSPRTNVKRHDYLKYARKKGDRAYVYAAHADYYILLRSCARVAQVDVRIMHTAVMGFERRLAWLETNIQHSLEQMPPCESCPFCNG